VETPPHMRPSERTNQTLIDPVPLDGGEAGVFRSKFAAVGKFEAPYLQTMRFIRAELRDSYIQLLRKQHGRVRVPVVRRQIVGSQTQRSLRARTEGVGWQP